MVLGVSQVEWITDSKVEFMGADIDKAAGAKCARCWIYKLDVGRQKNWPDVCGRCAQALENLPKKVSA